MTTYGLCEAWEAHWTCDLEGKTAGEIEHARMAASELLDALTGRQFTSGCQVTLRPCRRDCWAEVPPGWTAWPGGGLWLPLVCGACPGACSCGTALSEVILPALVNTVVEVRVDGSPLATGSYRVDDGRRLVRLGDAWPSCQDFTEADTETGTWSVTATYGQDLPELAKLAVGEVACEVLRALDGEDCRLPANVTQLVRQGVTIQMADPAAGLESGLLGTPWADRLVRAFNPAGLPARSRVYSVDRPSARHVGTA